VVTPLETVQYYKGVVNKMWGIVTTKQFAPLLHAASRMEVYIEQYCLVVGLEARTAIEMAKTIIFPAAIRYQGELALTCANLKAVGYVFDTDTLDKVTGLVKELQNGVAKLEAVLAEHGGGHSKLDHAKHLCKEVLPAMAALRKTADTLEGIVADDLWPLATYQEMLFIM
jgi:glutamine synthetase